MTEMQVGDQTVRCDREATLAIYASLRAGWAEDCGCVGCKNLMVQRDVIYPVAFVELLKRLGIDPNEEGEAVAYGRKPPNYRRSTLSRSACPSLES